MRDKIHINTMQEERRLLNTGMPVERERTLEMLIYRIRKRLTHFHNFPCTVRRPIVVLLFVFWLYILTGLWMICKALWRSASNTSRLFSALDILNSSQFEMISVLICCQCRFLSCKSFSSCNAWSLVTIFSMHKISLYFPLFITFQWK